jgi:hypothetical protein
VMEGDQSKSQDHLQLLLEPGAGAGAGAGAASGARMDVSEPSHGTRHGLPAAWRGFWQEMTF